MTKKALMYGCFLLALMTLAYALHPVVLACINWAVWLKQAAGVIGYLSAGAFGTICLIAAIALKEEIS